MRNRLFFKIFLENFTIFGKFDFFALEHFSNDHNFFIKHDSDMGFSGLLERYAIYENHIQPISNLTSVLKGDVMNVAKNSKLLNFYSVFAWDHFLNGHNFFIK